MKLLKYMSFALLAAAATGCSSDEGLDPNDVDPGSFFPSYADVAFQKCAPNPDQGVYDNTFKVQICRTSNAIGEKVRLEYSVKVYDAVSDSYVDGSKELFTVPAEYTYTTAEPMGYIPVVAHNELMEIGEPIMLTITILDDTAYGANTIEVQYTRVYPEESWTPVGTCNVIDGWICPIFGIDGNDYSFDCSFEVNDADEQLFRLVSPFQSKQYYAPLASFNIAPKNGRYYWQVDLNDFRVPAVLQSVSGWEFVPGTFNVEFGMLSLCSLEGQYMAEGYTNDEIYEGLKPEERSTFVNNVLNIGRCVLYAPHYQNAVVRNDTPGRITFPPHVSIYEDGAEGQQKIQAEPASVINRKLAKQYFGQQLSVKL